MSIGEMTAYEVSASYAEGEFGEPFGEPFGWVVEAMDGNGDIHETRFIGVKLDKCPQLITRDTLADDKVVLLMNQDRTRVSFVGPLAEARADVFLEGGEYFLGGTAEEMARRYAAYMNDRTRKVISYPGE